MEQGEGDSFLFNHRCVACGSPIAMRHDAIGEAMIKLDALATDADVAGDLCPLYCPACLADVLELVDPRLMLRQLDNVIREVDALFGKAAI